MFRHTSSIHSICLVDFFFSLFLQFSLSDEDGGKRMTKQMRMEKKLERKSREREKKRVNRIQTQDDDFWWEKSLMKGKNHHYKSIWTILCWIHYQFILLFFLFSLSPDFFSLHSLSWFSFLSLSLNSLLICILFRVCQWMNPSYPILIRGRDSNHQPD